MHKFNKNLEKYTENEIKNLSSNKITLAKKHRRYIKFYQKRIVKKNKQFKNIYRKNK